MNAHERYMRMAIELAKKAEGRTSPNPAVGAVIVRSGVVVGRGYHERSGMPHAEQVALAQAKGKADGATLYVTLEPCDHVGRTPPCTAAIIARGIREVRIGMRDPNPINNGRGAKRLRHAGMRVREGILKEECRNINLPYIKYITQGMPYITVKVAETLDGKIATRTGDARWVSGPESRSLAHELRSKVDAIMVGVNTVIRDDPQLSARIRREKSPARPIRVIVDSTLKTPLHAKVVKTASLAPLVIATTARASAKKSALFQKKGAEVIVAGDKRGAVDLTKLCKALARRGVVHIVVEGGGTLIASLLRDGLVDRVMVFIAPKIIGGRRAPSFAEGEGCARIQDALKVTGVRVRTVGDDILVEGNV